MTGWISAVLLGLGLGVAPGQTPAPAAPIADRTVRAQVRAALVADVLPRRNVSELRPTIDGQVTFYRGAATVHLDARLELLVAKRGGRVSDAVADAREAWVEWRRGLIDVRAGYGRLVWGRLDELAPSDVINPTDAARFLLEGRSEARLPVAFARVRVSPSERLRVEGVLAPRFRRGVFDRLGEGSSPFNLVRDALLPAGLAVSDRDRVQVRPDSGWGGMSGGARVDVTAGRVDGAVSVYRGFDAVGPVAFEADAPAAPGAMVVGRLVEYHPRFTMIGADLETVAGQWAWRAEAALFVDRTFISSGRGLRPTFVGGRSADAGGGFDRRAGDVRVFGMVVLHRQWSDAEPALSDTDVNVVASVERTFRRERFLGRAFGIWNPADRSGFVRGVWLWHVGDGVSVDVSAGTFLGTGDDTISQFKGRDFAFARLACNF